MWFIVRLRQPKASGGPTHFNIAWKFGCRKNLFTLDSTLVDRSREKWHPTTVPLEQRRAVNFGWYAAICFPVVFQEIGKTKRRRGSPTHCHDRSHIDWNNCSFGHLKHRLTLHRMTSFYFCCKKWTERSTFFAMVEKTCFGDTSKREGKESTSVIGSNACWGVYL